MKMTFFILMGLALGAVVAALLIGLFFMVKEGKENAKKSNKLMQARVILQGVAIALIFLAISIGGNE